MYLQNTFSVFCTWNNPVGPDPCLVFSTCFLHRLEEKVTFHPEISNFKFSKIFLSKICHLDLFVDENVFQDIWEWWCGPEDLVFRCLNFSHIDKYYWGARTSCKYTKLTQKYILLQRTLFSRWLQVIKVIQNRKRSLLFDCGSLTLLHRRVAHSTFPDSRPSQLTVCR